VCAWSLLCGLSLVNLNILYHIKKYNHIRAHDHETHSRRDPHTVRATRDQISVSYATLGCTVQRPHASTIARKIRYSRHDERRGDLR